MYLLSLPALFAVFIVYCALARPSDKQVAIVGGVLFALFSIIYVMYGDGLLTS